MVNGNLTAQHYIHQILQPHLIPHLEEHHELQWFRQDNAKPYVAHATRQFLNDQEVQTVPWVPYSPDLNPIEHLRGELGRRVMRRGHASWDLFIRILPQEWYAIPQDSIRNLIRTMWRRCTACVAAEGGHIPY